MPFPEPIVLPDGKKLRTLRQAAEHIRGLPKAVHDQEHWQIAVEHLLRASGHPAWLMFAHMAMHRALNHGKPEPVRETGKKRARVNRIVR